MKKVIVTGGAGFIGSNLVDGLVEKGYEVHVIDNLIAGKKENVNTKATLHIVDIRDITALEPLFKDVIYVFHLAALPRVQDSIEQPKEVHDVNVTGTLNVLIAAQKAKAEKFVFTSSAAVYGDQTIMPLQEDMKSLPKSPYGLHKYIGEEYAKLWSDLYELPTVSLRYFNVYGPHQSAQGSYPLVIAKFLDLYEQGKALTITGTGKQTRDYVHVSDIVQANIMAAENTSIKKGEVFNIGTGKGLSVLDIATIIGGEISFIPARIEPQDSRASIERAKTLLGWSPKVEIEEGITKLKKA